MDRENRVRKENLYYDCLEILKGRIDQIGNQRIHLHHVEPMHTGASKDGETIPCTYRDHARRHYIRWKVYGKFQDLAAYKGLVGKNEEMARIINEKRINTIKEKGILFYSIDFQRTQGLKLKKSYFLRNNTELALKWAYLGGYAWWENLD